MSPQDVAKYTPLQSFQMKQHLHVPFEHDPQVLAYFLYEYYSDVTSEVKQDQASFTIDEVVTVRYLHKAELLEIEWLSSEKADMIADSICLLCLQIKDQPSP